MLHRWRAHTVRFSITVIMSTYKYSVDFIRFSRTSQTHSVAVDVILHPINSERPKLVKLRVCVPKRTQNQQ